MGPSTGGPNKPAKYACAFIAGLALACVAAVLSRQAQGLPAPTHRLLMAASTGFVLVGLIGGALRSTYGRLMLAGLLLCWLGDYLGPDHFLASLIAAFTTRGLSRGRFLITSGAFVLFDIVIGIWLFPHVENAMLLPVLVYMLLITLMAGAAGAIQSGRGRSMLLIAGAIFYVSDIFVARWHFVVDDAANAYYCYPLYYAACLMLAFSILLYRPDDLVEPE